MFTTWLGTFFGKANTSCVLLGYNCRLSLSYSENSLVLIASPVLPAWLLANQCFIKNNTSDVIKDHCPSVELETEIQKEKRTKYLQ